MQYTITEQELINHKHDMHLILQILKEKGAPIVGTFSLDIDENFKIFSTKEKNGDLVFIFEKISKCKHRPAMSKSGNEPWTLSTNENGDIYCSACNTPLAPDADWLAK